MRRSWNSYSRPDLTGEGRGRRRVPGAARAVPPGVAGLYALASPSPTGSALPTQEQYPKLEENLAAAGKTTFSSDELAAIDNDAVEAGINIWARSSSH